jgi:hypothetical protein
VSIAHLCDHRADMVFRPPIGEDVTQDELQNVVEVWQPLATPAGLNCRPNQAWSGHLQDHGPGEQQGAQRQWFLVPGFNVQARDVVRIASGQEAPVLLRVLSVTQPTAPLALHHIEINVEVYSGDVTEAEIES